MATYTATVCAECGAQYRPGHAASGDDPCGCFGAHAPKVITVVPQEYADHLDAALTDEKFAHEDTLIAAKAAHIRAEKAEEALRALDEALDDLPRYMAVSQPAEGWMPALGAQPVLTACVSVDHARAMLTQAASTPQSQQTAGPTEGE